MELAARHGLKRRAAPANRARPVLRPMLATLGTPGVPPRGDDWCFEIKWDGVRILAVLGPDGTELITRNDNHVAVRYPELAELHRAVRTNDLPTVIDGEIVAFDESAKPNFHLLQSRMHLNGAARIQAVAERAPVHLAMFDILVQAGEPLIDLPYTSRREHLRGLDIESEYASVPRAYSDGKALLRRMADRGMEGMIAKRAASRYRPGVRSPDWVKVKCKLRQEFVVGGWTEGSGHRADSFGSLLLGYHDRPGSRSLTYAGNVGSGFNERDLAIIGRELLAAETGDSPFDAALGSRETHFVKPELVVEVEFQEITPDGMLRQPVFKGLRDDKRPKEVVLERPQS